MRVRLREPLNVYFDEVIFNLVDKCLLKFVQQAFLSCLSTFLLKLSPLYTALYFWFVHSKHVDAVLFKEGCVVRMGNQVEVQYILWLDKPDEDVLADLT